MIVVIVLAAVILLPLALFSPFGTAGVSRYMSELALLLLWVFAAAITLGVAARLFPPEFENRTMWPLLAKPVSRFTVVVGKYLGALLAAVSALLVFYMGYTILAGIRTGVWVTPILVQAFIMHVGFVALLAAITLLGSLVMTPSANITLCGLATVGMLIYGQRLPVLAAAQPQPVKAIVHFIYWIAPHFEFFDLRQRVVHEWPALGWGVCGVVALYTLCYVGLCLALAGRAFRNKRF
jgi:ABC-type transport system involved in multi-copper enzyme maturation permease subunit